MAVPKKTGSGWHKESLRHSRAKRFGRAGGSYSLYSKGKKISSHPDYISAKIAQHEYIHKHFIPDVTKVPSVHKDSDGDGKKLKKMESLKLSTRKKGHYKVGDVVMVKPNNDNENYNSFRNRKLRITNITKKGEHPAFDDTMGDEYLYDFEDAQTGESIGNALYDYELA